MAKERSNEGKVPARDKQGARTGFTTGACSAAAAKAAARCLVHGTDLESIQTRLPNRQEVTFSLERCEHRGERVLCSVIKDAGDDPDCTHGAELIAEVTLSENEGIHLVGGDGVAAVTKPGLGLDLEAPAINPVPRRNITQMVSEELADSPWSGAAVTVHVPGGEEMAKQTTNTRLGLIGGISILGTTGIVRPYSTAAFKASVAQGVDVARTHGYDEVVLTTGGKSEQYAMALFPELSEEAFVQMGDFVGVAIRQCARRGARRAKIVGMMGKLSKMADGKMQTHAAGSQVNMELLAGLASELGADASLCEAIRKAATARRVLELCTEAGLGEMTALVCREVVNRTTDYVGGGLEVQVYLIGFDGRLLSCWPRDAAPREAS